MRTTLARATFDLKSTIFQRRDRAQSAAMRRAETLDPEELSTLQGERAIALARHAFETTEFYRDHYSAAGIQAADLTQPGTFAHLPVLEKHHIREAGDRLRSTSARGELLKSSTGGSTGAPLVVRQDPRTPAASLWWRAHRWWGIHPGDDSAYIYRRSRTARQELLHRATWWPTRQFLLDARAMDDTTMRAFADTWQRVQPALLTAYVDGLHEFARFCEREGLELTPPRAIAATASVLTPPKRAYIESRLAAPVFDCYRSAEVPWLAAQCRERGPLHVYGDVRAIEIVTSDGDPAADGVQGDVLVTDLLNQVFPIIRYRIGDRSSTVAGRCPCGMTLPRITPIDGRMADVLRSPSGSMVTGGLSTLFNDTPTAVQQFQLHQHADYSIELRYVPGASDADAASAAASAADRVQSLLGGGVSIRTRPVADIEHVGGKARLVTSEIEAR